MIEVQHLTKRYGPVTAVNDISFKVEKGEILGFLGPNGAGKTTTMRILTGYMPATEGKAMIAGYDVFSDPIAAKQRTGYLPETPPLYPDMTVREYLTFVARIKIGQAISTADRNSRVDSVMKKTFITDMANRHCAKLSKGYRQRVGIAQALIHDPDVLILDEPTAGLDPKQIMETRDLIRGLAGSHTIVLSTHILPEVSQTCQRVVIISRGKVVAIDTPANLTKQVLGGGSNLYVNIEADGGNVVETLSAISGVKGVAPSADGDGGTAFEVTADKDHDIRREVARAIVNRGWGLLELRPLRLSLEETFLQLTTEERQQPAEETPAAPSEVTHGQ